MARFGDRPQRLAVSRGVVDYDHLGHRRQCVQETGQRGESIADRDDDGQVGQRRLGRCPHRFGKIAIQQRSSQRPARRVDDGKALATACRQHPHGVRTQSNGAAAACGHQQPPVLADVDLRAQAHGKPGHWNWRLS